VVIHRYELARPTLACILITAVLLTHTDIAWHARADRDLKGGEYAAAGVVGAVGVVAAGGVGVAALVGGDHHAAVLRQPLHTLLHAAVVVGATVIAPAHGCKFKISISTKLPAN
jgi:hypothetical protein